MEVRSLRLSVGRAVAYPSLLAVIVLAGCDATPPGAAGRDPGQAVYEFEGKIAGSDPWNVVALAKESGNVLWRHGMGGMGSGAWPLQSGSMVYASAKRGDSTILQALDASSGQERWERTPPGAISTNPAVDGDLLFLASNSDKVHDNGTLEIDGTLEALRVVDGSVVWHMSLRGGTHRPMVAGDTVYLIARPRVLAFNRENGMPLWSYDTGDLDGIEAPLVNGGTVYVEPVARDSDGTAKMQLTALNAETGTLEWSYQTIGIESLPALDGNTIYVTATYQALPASSIVSAVDTQTGALRWSYTSPPYSIATGPVGVDGRVYLALGGDPSSVLALDGTDGNQIWLRQLDRVATGISGDPPLFADGLLGVVNVSADYHNQCFAVLNSGDGSLRWCKSLPTYNLDHTIVSNGVIYTSLYTSYTSNHPEGDYAAVRFADGTVLWDAH